MKLQFVEAGEIVTTHGVKGEVKVLPWVDSPDILCEFDRCRISGKEYTIETCRVQKTCNLLKLAGSDTMELGNTLDAMGVTVNWPIVEDNTFIITILYYALMFGVIHFIPQQVVNAFVIGLILGFIYVRTDSLWPVIIIHALNNAMAYVVMQWSDGANITVRSLIENDTIYAVVYGVALAAFVASGYMVWRSIEKINSKSSRA